MAGYGDSGPTSFRAVPILNRAMCRSIIDRPDDHGYECRVYDDYPEAGGKLVRVDKPREREIPNAWKIKFNDRTGPRFKAQCEACGNDFQRRNKQSIRCSTCQEAHNRAENRRISRERYQRMKAEKAAE